MLQKSFTILVLAALITACSSTPKTMPTDKRLGVRQGTLSLPDKTAFLQKDKRWADEYLGRTRDTMGSDGCLVTATAMALGNLGFETDPSDLNKRLTETDSFTKQGWLIWSGIDKVTDGRATARYYDDVSTEIIDGCMRDGYYPLTRFILPNGRSHWAMVVKRDRRGFHMRDPLQPHKHPLIFPRGVEAFKAVRCVGVADKA
jgi:hypothetical protein